MDTIWKLYTASRILIDQCHNRLYMPSRDILLALCNLSDCFPYNMLLQHRSYLIQFCDWQCHSSSKSILVLGCIALLHRLRMNIVIALCRILRQLADMLHRPVIQFLHHRQYTVPDLVSCIGKLSICRILTKILSAFFQIRFDFCTRHTEQRADDIPPARRDPGKPVQSTAPKYMEQHRLRDIILVVRDGDLIEFQLHNQFFHTLIAILPSRFLNSHI